MKGILFKDFLSAKRILTIYLLMIICFSFGGAKGVFFALCYSIMVPVNLLGFDERSRFDRYASVLPLTGLQCVADKYIVTYLCMAVMMALSSLIAFLRTGAASAMEDMLLYAATVLATHALCMPLLIRMGVTKGQWVYLLSDLIVLVMSLSYIPVRRIGYSLFTVLLSGQLIGFVQNFNRTQETGADCVTEN